VQTAAVKNYEPKTKHCDFR